MSWGPGVTVTYWDPGAREAICCSRSHLGITGAGRCQGEGRWLGSWEPAGILVPPGTSRAIRGLDSQWPTGIPVVEAT